MKCIIPGVNVKVFGRAIHSLARIGDELYMEPLQDGLALRTVNSSRSAYACFLFTPKFFIHYNDHSSVLDDKTSFKCKIGMKSCVSVFKSLSMLEKSVERCQITMDTDQTRLVYTLYCRHGIVKTYKLAFIECESLQAVFSKHLCPNIVSAQTRLLSESVANFQSNQEEVSLIVTSQKLLLKNYIEDEPDPSKVMRTELSLETDEFERYQVGEDTEVTFCLKELRAILSFSEMANMPITINFSSPGKPIVFCIENESSFEANFVLATLAAENCGPERASQISQKNGIHNSQQAYIHNGSVQTTHNSVHQKKMMIEAKDGENDTTMPTDRQDADDADDGRHTSPLIPLQAVTQNDRCTDNKEAEQDEKDEDVVPGTPPNKKCKLLFFGLSQCTEDGAVSQPPLVLAGDTDDEND